MLPTHRSFRSTGRFWKSLLFGELSQFGNALKHIFSKDITQAAIFAKKKNFDVVQLLCKSGFGANSESSLHWGFNKVSFLILVAETIPACTLSRKSWLSIYGRPEREVKAISSYSIKQICDRFLDKVESPWQQYQSVCTLNC